MILSDETWTPDNEILTPTLKVRREQVEARFAELAEQLARRAAETGELQLERVETARA